MSQRIKPNTDKDKTSVRNHLGHVLASLLLNEQWFYYLSITQKLVNEVLQTSVLLHVSVCHLCNSCVSEVFGVLSNVEWNYVWHISVYRVSRDAMWRIKLGCRALYLFGHTLLSKHSTVLRWDLEQIRGGLCAINVLALTLKWIFILQACVLN